MTPIFLVIQGENSKDAKAAWVLWISNDRSSVYYAIQLVLSSFSGSSSASFPAQHNLHNAKGHKYHIACVVQVSMGDDLEMHIWRLTISLARPALFPSRRVGIYVRYSKLGDREQSSESLEGLVKAHSSK